MGNRDILSTSAEFQKVKYESLLEMDNKKISFGDCKVAPWVRVLANKPYNLSSMSELTQWKERNDSWKLSSVHRHTHK